MLDELLNLNIIHNSIPYFFVLLISILTTSLTIPFLIKYAKINSLYDLPNSRKFNNLPTIRIGGISIILGFYFSILFVKYVFSIDFANISLLITLCIFSFFYFLIGFIDDIKSLSPFLRLSLQVFLACIVWTQGLKISYLDLSFNSSTPFFLNLPNILSLVVTLIWIVGTINAINWIDGLDGLAGGIIFITAISIFILGIYSQKLDQSILALSLAGTCLGFLKYNVKPARILMGDGGSYFLGFLISSLLIISAQNINNSINILQPIFLLFVPLIDMCFVILYRLINRKSPFHPDNNHFHHRIIALGFTDKDTVFLIWLISILIIILYFLISNF